MAVLILRGNQRYRLIASTDILELGFLWLRSGLEIPDHSNPPSYPVLFISSPLSYPARTTGFPKIVAVSQSKGIMITYMLSSICYWKKKRNIFLNVCVWHTSNTNISLSNSSIGFPLQDARKEVLITFHVSCRSWTQYLNSSAENHSFRFESLCVLVFVHKSRVMSSTLILSLECVTELYQQSWTCFNFFSTFPQLALHFGG